MRGVRGSPFVGDFNIIYLGPEEFFLILIQITFLAIPLCHLEVIVGFFLAMTRTSVTKRTCTAVYMHRVVYQSCALTRPN